MNVCKTNKILLINRGVIGCNYIAEMLSSKALAQSPDAYMQHLVLHARH